MQNKILSIYVPTYNRAEKVVRQLKFLINEMKEIDTNDIEIVVNNNCSTDDTEEKILRVIEGTSIIYHKNDTNLGIVGNIYEAPKLISGKYFWVVSDDDNLRHGIVKRILEIVKNNTNISYIFFNYSDIADVNEVAYTGPTGLVKDGAAMVTNGCREYINILFLTSSSVYLKRNLMETIHNLPLENQRSYGWSGYAALASLKCGDAFFDGRVWVHNDPQNMSWKDIKYESNMGVLRMFEKLNLVGYKQKQIRAIYHCWINGTLIGGKIIWHLFNTKNLLKFLSDFLFCLRKAPCNVIKISWKLVVGKLKFIICKNN